MKQFILSVFPDNQGIIQLYGKDYHYLVRVRRLLPGAFFSARLPDEREVQVRVQSIGKTSVIAVCSPCSDDGETLPKKMAPRLPPILLFQALPKGAKMDLIIRQAVEGGIGEIVPFVSAHAISRPAESSARRERWQRILTEARQQSGSAIATTLHPLLTLDELLEYWKRLQNAYPRALGILFHEIPLEQRTLHYYLDSTPDLVIAAVGPEGGFSPEEAGWFLAAGFKSLAIGDTILRTETAALYAAAAIRTILWERTSWTLKVP